MNNILYIWFIWIPVTMIVMSVFIWIPFAGLNWVIKKISGQDPHL